MCGVFRIMVTHQKLEQAKTCLNISGLFDPILASFVDPLWADRCMNIHVLCQIIEMQIKNQNMLVNLP